MSFCILNREATCDTECPGILRPQHYLRSRQLVSLRGLVLMERGETRTDPICANDLATYDEI